MRRRFVATRRVRRQARTRDLRSGRAWRCVGGAGEGADGVGVRQQRRRQYKLAWRCWRRRGCVWCSEAHREGRHELQTAVGGASERYCRLKAWTSVVDSRLGSKARKHARKLGRVVASKSFALPTVLHDLDG